MKVIALFLTLFCVSANADQNSCRLKLNSMSSELVALLTPMLDTRGVTWRVVGENRICVSERAVSILREVMAEFLERYLPVDRSVSADHRLMSGYRKVFGLTGIAFKEYQFDGSTYFVWGEEQAALARSIIDAENRRFFSQN